MLSILTILAIGLILGSVLASSTGNNSLTFEKAKEAFENKDFQKAKELFESVVKTDSTSAVAFYFLGKINIFLGDSDAAIKFLEKAATLENENADYFYWFGNAIGSKVMKSSGSLQESLALKAKENFSKAVKLDSKHVPANSALINHLMQAPPSFGGNIDEALKKAKSLIPIEEKMGRYFLAQVYERKDEVENAESEYKILESKFGNLKDFYDFYNFYGYLLLAQKRFGEAIEKFQKQVKLAPNKDYAFDSLGDGFLAAGKIEDAKVAFERALELNPNSEVTKNKLKDLDKK
ncbi:MAG: hypothetical protein DWQ06_04535 [Calditrichaeota bacterium]|nr:MAG: hypothetical protein DWQ06_04535 [Calditrichota bacterium]